MDGEALAIFLCLTFTAIVIGAFVFVFVKIAKSEGAKKRMEEAAQRYAEKQAGSADEQHASQSDKMKQIAQAFGLRVDYDGDKQAAKHAKHVEDSRAHEHLGEEEHYEEIVGSLGEVNDEGCQDLAGVRFLAHDIAYELQNESDVDYDRLAQAMVLGEIINTPRFKTPYSKNR